jgi:hypothetical protein
MPLIRSQSSPETAGIKELVQELAGELRSPLDVSRPLRQPVIIENEVGTERTLHVVVIWERWQLIPAPDRSSVIMQAYESAASDRIERIMMTLGVTLEEAVDLGLMPYGIEPTVRKTDEACPENVERLMRQEGAVVTPSGLLLRFPSLEGANASYERLARQSDPRFWAIVKYEKLHS